MAYYVSLGSRGILLRIGTGLIGVVNGLIYWRASRRRRLSETLVAVSVPDHEHERPVASRED